MRVGIVLVPVGAGADADVDAGAFTAALVPKRSPLYIVGKTSQRLSSYLLSHQSI
jgi:hypothetical protein